MSDAVPGRHISRAHVFACISMFDGGVDLNPENFKAVIAVSSGNSIFVAEKVLSDPFERTSDFRVKHVIGNIGHPGITLMIAPEIPRIKSPSNDFMAVTHADYDYRREDNFTGTSLHLSFTGWKMPVTAQARGFIDQDVHMVESVISVHDNGDWIGDLDIMAIQAGIYAIHIECNCQEPAPRAHQRYTSIDSWNDLLDPPETVAIIRAKGNWAARLAAVSILRQKYPDSRMCVFGQETICWRCLERKWVVEKDSADFLID